MAKGLGCRASTPFHGQFARRLLYDNLPLVYTIPSKGTLLCKPQECEDFVKLEFTFPILLVPALSLHSDVMVRDKIPHAKGCADDQTGQLAEVWEEGQATSIRTVSFRTFQAPVLLGIIDLLILQE